MFHPDARLRRTVSVMLLTAAACFAATACRAGAAPDAAVVLKEMAGPRGVCALVGDTECRLALDLARASELVIYVQLANAEDVEAACRAADAAGLYGTRIFVAKGGPETIHLADNVADAVVAVGAAPSKAEALRVLRPDGKALVGGAAITKPWPDGVDDWSHHYHGPDNNSQTKDQLARAPYLTQFIAEPRYAPAPQAAVSSGGRLFMAFGNVAWHEREEPWMNTLIAVNGFNGTMLWKRPLRQGHMVDRPTMIATPETLYLGGATSCQLLDAVTGKVTGEITVPQNLTDGPFWKWMALEGGVLYALVGETEKPDADATWRRRAHGWPWGGISQGYNAAEYEWGFAPTLFAIDPRTKKVLWHHREQRPIDSRGISMKSGRIFICRFGEYLACLDSETGKEVWRRTADKDAELFEAVGPYRPGHGYVGGWKSTVYLKCTDKALYFLGPQVNWLTAVSAADGKFLWKYPAKDLHIVIRDEGLYTIGPQKSQNMTHKLDPLTGSVLASYDLHRRACTRSVGTPDGIIFRTQGGTQRLDLASGKPQYISTMRPSCHVGVVVAGGHLYWVPWVCDCNLQMFGVICCGPAGDFAFDAKATEAGRLEAAGAAKVAALDVAADDWPTHRAGAAREARSNAAVPEKVSRLWEYKPKAAYDPTAPVAAGGMVFVSGSDGIVHAFDAANGNPKWTAYTGGAVRYPPTIADGRAYVGSGDGWAYCFEAATGRPLWRFRAAPQERRIPVYGTLSSTWPVSSGVLVHDGVAYLAAGINNYDGTHLYALDAATGKIRWQNNSSGHLDAFSHRGVAAQGDMLLHAGRLYLAGGNAVSPATYDAADGKCLNPPPTGWMSPAPRGRELALDKGQVRVSGQALYSNDANPVFDNPVKWADAVIQAKNARLSCEQRGTDAAPAWALVAAAASGKELWTQPLPAETVRWGIAVDREGRVVATLRDGRVVCYGAGG
ncbi:MAG TPA: PQQ-binding-like beta-propeller repeat protein [Phycisphaerae bacterium]|nr:PQQ-binding-like beta-propeller repeat protein [Phycisphaerae bacterium]